MISRLFLAHWSHSYPSKLFLFRIIICFIWWLHVYRPISPNWIINSHRARNIYLSSLSGCWMNLVREATDWQRGEQIFCVRRRLRFAFSWPFLDYNPNEIISTDSIVFFILLYSLSSVQSLSHVQLFETPWIAAHQASLSITNPRSLLKLMPIESVMPILNS